MGPPCEAQSLLSLFGRFLLPLERIPFPFRSTPTPALLHSRGRELRGVGGMEGHRHGEADDEEEELGLRLGLASAGASAAAAAAAGEPPSVGMEFPTSEAAREFYCAYADRAGFAVRTDKSRRSRRDDSVIMRRFVCTREGFHPTRHDDLTESEAAAGKRRRKRLIIREGCMAMCEVTKKEPPLRWVVTKFVAHHVHPVSLPLCPRPPPAGESDGLAGEHAAALDEPTQAATEPSDEPTGAPAAARWDYVIHKYNLEENTWLQSLYDTRQQWAWVYQKGSFFPELLKSQRSERLNNCTEALNSTKASSTSI
uniref:FAR1 domain-containing protein n=1 Tax=Oryza nivara TaxID=4536 RepID=A0A0E0HV83_ORYNI